MKVQIRFLKPLTQVAVATCLFVAGYSAHAQGVVRVQNAYPEDQERVLPFAGAAPSGGNQKAAPAPVATVAPEASTWKITASDGTISRALLRWAREAQTQVTYEAPSDLAAVSVTYTGDFWAALESLLADTANGGYPLHGCQYNNVTRILHISQPCDR